MLITINPIDFIVRKNTYTPNQSILDKYSFIIGRHSCFREETASHYSHHHPNNHTFNADSREKTLHYKRHTKKKHIICNNISQPPPFLTPHKDKDSLRLIMGLLNVINTDNYSKIFMKLRLLIDNDNLPKLVDVILEKCCIATIFVNIYIKLLEDIGNIFDISYNIFKWVDSAKTKIILKETNIGTLDSYDEFCRLQKHKLYVAGMTTTLIKLTKACLINNTYINDYFDFVERKITNLEDEYYLDIYLNIMIDICKAYKEFLTPSKEIVEKLPSNVSPRIKFLMQAI